MLLNALGVASSHAVGFTSSTQGVQREKLEPGAMLLRTSECHIRLGHFEWINQYAPELGEFTQKLNGTIQNANKRRATYFSFC